MSFRWNQDPAFVFPDGFENYTIDLFAELFALCEDYAAKIQDWMRQNAPWEDTCMPNREYLVAEAFYPDRWSVGIRVYYDLDLYRSQCGEPVYDWGTRHEFTNFSKVGPISVIIPGGTARGALGDLVDELWDRVRALFV